MSVWEVYRGLNAPSGEEGDDHAMLLQDPWLTEGAPRWAMGRKWGGQGLTQGAGGRDWG